MDATQRTGNDQAHDDEYAKYDTQSQTFLCRTWRQRREDEMLFLREGGCVRHHSVTTVPALLRIPQSIADSRKQLLSVKRLLE